MSILIVDFPKVGVGQGFIRICDFNELLLGSVIAPRYERLMRYFIQQV